MEEIGERWVWHHWPLTHTPIPLGGLNVLTVGNSILAVLLLWFVLWLATRKRSLVPGRAQMAVEALVGSWRGMVDGLVETDSAEDKLHVTYRVVCLFIFIATANALPFIPFHVIEEPTNDLNCTLGLALLSVGTSVYYGIRYRGVGGFLAELCGPMWHQHDAKGAGLVLGKLSGLFFFPLEVSGQFSRILSLSFRLFGNIMGATVVVTVVSYLTYGLATPLMLDAFFLVFEAGVQAFVFAMLTIIYIAVSIK